MACSNQGIFFNVESEDDSKSGLASTMKNYFIFLAEGTSIEKPVWTEPYDDAFGFGRLVTVSMPIYYEERDVRKILGVAGIDVVMAKLTDSFGLSE